MAALLSCETANHNSFHVVVGADRAILDGFIITKGDADGPYSDNTGAGIYCDSVSFTLSNCTIIDNNCTNDGGGMYCEDSSVTVRNCVFADNTAGAFGGADAISDGNVDWEDLLKLAEHRLVGVE